MTNSTPAEAFIDSAGLDTTEPIRSWHRCLYSQLVSRSHNYTFYCI
jgi:hypothetical protein